ncbi:MAG: hypothetical protein HFJ12_05460 [Bacilli bacterium]|nr:hypothetical protein [Bacilli bacterium]
MLEFKTLEELKPNNEILEIIKNYSYKVKKGKTKHLLHTNLKFIEPTEYLITYPTTLTILEYKVNEISNKPFYIKEHNQKYSLTEIIQILKKFKV